MSTKRSPILLGALAVLFAFLAFTTPGAHAAPIVNLPVTITQPDGTVLELFATGDEYYHWLHDAEGFTIVQHPQTGYFVYANLLNDKLVATKHIVGKVDPATVGLRPFLNIPAQKMGEIRQMRLAQAKQTADGVKNAPRTGALHNPTIFMRFSDETEFTDNVSIYTEMFNSTTADVNSLLNYYRDASYNALTLSSSFYPNPTGATVISYKNTHPRAYYQPYNAVTNTIGYKTPAENAAREQTLIKDAITYVKTLGQFPGGAVLDADGDSYVDSMTFVFKGAPDGWGDMLWPHAWSLFQYTVTINGKTVGGYNIQFQTDIGPAVLAHEMFHVLGAPDLYHYTDNGITPTGYWDVMSDGWSNPPQHMGCFMKFRYGTWISSIPQITTPGTYTLNPLASATNNCYKIASPYSTTEYFVLEYRSQASSFFETMVPGSGLLVYRINTAADGNGNGGGPPDEVYIYRPDGTTTVDGDLSIAHLTSDAGRSSINSLTNPSTFLADGSAAGLSICNVGAAGGTISFDYGTCSPIRVSPEAWDFGTQNAGSTSSAQTFTITNTGAGDVNLGALAATGDFSLSNDQCSGQTIGASGTCTFDVAFSPASEGSKNGSIAIPSDDPNSPDSVALKGNGQATAYCSSSQQTDEYISRVQLNTGSRTSAGGGYQNFTSVNLTSLNPGAAYILQATGTIPSGTYRDYAKAWVDFNQDFDFTDSGEELDLGSFTYTGSHIFSGNFAIPNDALVGPTRMRVILNWDAAPGPCSTGGWGETEDYTVTISTDVTPPDTNIATGPATPTNSTSATFTFSGTDDTSLPGKLAFECGLDGGAWTACVSPKKYTGLTAGDHWLYVRARDEVGNYDDTPPVYTWKVAPTVVKFYSAAANDGWILETGENTTLGGTFNATADNFSLGDDAANKQYRGLLSFSTASLPDNAVITKITLKMTKKVITGGGNPIATFQGFQVDVKKGFIGTAASLQAADFQTPVTPTLTIPSVTPVGNVYSLNLTNAKAAINLATANGGLTQLRLRFKLDDNNNKVANFISFFSANTTTVANRPQLLIEYYVP